MPDCGSQIILCDLPIRYDTYSGCSHACKYCFVTRKTDISHIERGESIESLKKFIAGKRTGVTEWCDWNIPLHWGGMSDPFQVAERDMRQSYEALKVFADTQYPFVVSTKGTPVLADPEYLALLEKCRAVVQVSLVAPIFDAIEPGAPSFAQRLKDIAIISKHCLRVIVRIQPYIREALPAIIANMERYAAAGIYGVTVEGIKYFKKKPGLIKIGTDWVYPRDILNDDFGHIRDAAHKVGLKFFCAENRLRSMGNALCCCGIAGLEGFRGNTANATHFVADGKIDFSDNMEKCSSQCFKALCQDSVSERAFRLTSFAEMMRFVTRDKKYLEMLK